MAAQIAAAGGTAAAFPADVTDAAAVDAMAAGVRTGLGAPTILVNAAGVFGPIRMVRDVDPDAWVATVMVNAMGPFRTVRAFLPGMLEQGWGRIVNVTSAASLHPPGALNSAYGTSKAALNQFTRHLAAEVHGTGVTANVFHPGDVKTEIWADIRDQVAGLGPGGRRLRPLGRLGRGDRRRPAREGRRPVLRVAGDERAVGQRTVPVDRGRPPGADPELGRARGRTSVVGADVVST